MEFPLRFISCYWQDLCPQAKSNLPGENVSLFNSMKETGNLCYLPNGISCYQKLACYNLLSRTLCHKVETEGSTRKCQVRNTTETVECLGPRKHLIMLASSIIATFMKESIESILKRFVWVMDCINIPSKPHCHISSHLSYIF